jgi:hypothetical protein
VPERSIPAYGRFEAQHTVNSIHCADFHDWIMLHEGPQGSPGLLTTNSSKEVMTVALQELLSKNHLHYASSFVSVSETADEIKQKLAQELRRFMILVEAPKSLFGKPRRTYSGKLGGQNDDVAIALMLAVWGMQIFYNDDKYVRFLPEDAMASRRRRV